MRLTCGVQLKDRKKSTDFMLMFGLKEAIDQFAMAVFMGMVMRLGEKMVMSYEGH